MTPKHQLEATQMNLQFCDTTPLILPQDKQRELAAALTDLLLNAATVELSDPNSLEEESE